jgi:hypothetical protein
MCLERKSRRSDFETGVDVRLSDGETWTLPIPSLTDPEYYALIAVVLEAEDRVEVLLAELALTIFLLDRNYELEPEQLSSLLCFSADDPALAALQDAVHDLVVEIVDRNPCLAASRRKEGLAQRTTPDHSRLTSADRVRSIWTFRMVID